MAAAVSNIDGRSTVTASGVSGKPETKTEIEYYVLAIAVVVIGAVAGWICSTRSSLHVTEVAQLNSGISVFALLYVGAQVVERILVPIAPLATSTTASSNTPATTPDGTSRPTGAITKATAEKAVRAWSVACESPSIPTPITDTTPADDVQQAVSSAQDQATSAATWLELLKQAKQNGNTTLWALASALGMVVSGVTNIHLIRILVVDWTHPTLDIIATGLVLGGGSKGLHDLIANLQDKGGSAGATAAAGG
jgi:hypothetical protein